MNKHQPLLILSATADFPGHKGKLSLKSISINKSTIKAFSEMHEEMLPLWLKYGNGSVSHAKFRCFVNLIVIVYFNSSLPCEGWQRSAINLLLSFSVSGALQTHGVCPSFLITSFDEVCSCASASTSDTCVLLDCRCPFQLSIKNTFDESFFSCTELWNDTTVSKTVLSRLSVKLPKLSGTNYELQFSIVSK